MTLPVPEKNAWPKIQAALKQVTDNYDRADQWQKLVDKRAKRDEIERVFSKGSRDWEVASKPIKNLYGFNNEEVYRWVVHNYGPGVMAEDERIFWKVADAANEFINSLADKREWPLANLDKYTSRLRSYYNHLEKTVASTFGNAAPAHFTYKGFKISNPDRLADPMVMHLLRAIDYLVALFKKHGMEDALREGVKEVQIRFQRPGDTLPTTGGLAVGWYFAQQKRIEFLHPAARAGKGRIMKDWAREVFLHEFGHHIHLNELHPRAKEEWDSAWEPVDQAKSELESRVQQELAVSHQERLRYWNLLKDAEGDLGIVRRGLKGMDRLKAHAWLREPMLGAPLVTPKQFRWSKDGQSVGEFIADPEGFYAHYEKYGHHEVEEQVKNHWRRLEDKMGVEAGYAGISHPALSDDLVEKYRAEDKSVDEAIKALDVPTGYAKTNEKEDFAESFVAFMENPDALSDTGRFRMQRALSLSGLYGKPIMKLGAGVEVKMGPFLRGLQEYADELAEFSYQNAEKARSRQYNNDDLADRAEEILGVTKDTRQLRRDIDLAGAVNAIQSALFAKKDETMGSGDLDAWERVYKLSRELMDYQDALDEYESFEDVQAKMQASVKEIADESRVNAAKISKAVTDAIGRIDPWGSSKVSIKPMGSEDELRSARSFHVVVGNQHAGFTVFLDKSGKVEGFGDELEAGDTDFFRDPADAMDYFNLLREMRKPGSTQKAGKDIVLWTARPTKDRKLYERARTVPPNIFLTTDPDRAEGISRDLGGGKARDLWRMVINERHLMKTLDTGRTKDYQVIGSKPVPVKRVELVAEGKLAALTVANRYLLGTGSVDALRRRITQKMHTVEDVVSGKHPIGTEGRGGRDIEVARRHGLYTFEQGGHWYYARSPEDAEPLKRYLERGGQYGTLEFSRLLGYTARDIEEYGQYLELSGQRQRRGSTRVADRYLAAGEPEVKILRFARLLETALPDWGMELFVLERAGTYYLATWKIGGTGLTFGVVTRGSESAVNRAFDSEVKTLEAGAAHSNPHHVATERLDSDARKHVEFMEDGKWGVDWGSEVAELDAENFEQQEFYKFLKTQIAEWVYANHHMPVTKHPYWPTFHAMVIEAVKEQFGSNIKLWRGVQGPMAVEVLQGGPFHTYDYASWTHKKNYAKEFILYDKGYGVMKDRVKSHWVVVQTTYPVSSVVLAPVKLPEFEPNPDILYKWLKAEGEFVIHDPSEWLKPGQFKVTAKTSKPVPEERVRLAFPERVAARWLRASYQGHHAPSEGPPAHNIGDGTFVPEDILTHPEWYTGFQGQLRSFWPALLDAQGRPGAKLTIYRALPGEHTTFNRGDWITLSPQYARDHASGEDGWHVIKATVPAKDVRWAGDDLAEWGYWGPKVEGKVAFRSRRGAHIVMAGAKHYKLDRSKVRKLTERDPEAEAETGANWGFYEYRVLEIVPIRDIVPEKVWSEAKLRAVEEDIAKGRALGPIKAQPGRGGKLEITDGIHRYNASVRAGLTHIPVAKLVHVEAPEMLVEQEPEKPKLRVGDWVKFHDPKDVMAASPWARVVGVLHDRDWKGVKRHFYSFVGFDASGEPEYLGDIMDNAFDAASNPPPEVEDDLQDTYEVWV